MKRSVVGLIGVVAVGLPLLLAVWISRDTSSGSAPVAGRAGVLSERVPLEVTEVVGQAVTWTGNSLFSYGGVRLGAAFRGEMPHTNTALLIDPDSKLSLDLPDPPVDGALGSSSVVMLGESTVVLGGEACKEFDLDNERCQPGTFQMFTLDLSSLEWTTIRMPDVPDHRGSTPELVDGTSGGLAVVRFGPDHAPDYRTYDPTSGDWINVPTPPLRRDAECVDGDKLVVATAQYLVDGELLEDDPLDLAEPGTVVSTGEDDGFASPSVAVLDLAKGGTDWQVSGPATDMVLPQESPGVDLTCTAGTAALHDAGSQMHLHSLESDLKAPWLAIPDPDPYYYSSVLSADDGFILLSGLTDGSDLSFPGRSFSLESQRWTTEPNLPPSSPSLAVAGDRIVGFLPPADPGADTRTVSTLVSVEIRGES